MRIEIACSNNSTYSLLDFEPKLSVLASMSDNTISLFRSIKRFVNNMSGGVGILQGALDLLDARLAFEEGRKNDLINMHDKVTDFVGIVKKVDSAVSERVSTSQNEFYDVHPWAKPSALSVALDSWYNGAQNWLKSALKRTADAIDHVWNVYNETDYRALSAEELQKVCDDYIRLIESESLTNDDKIRLQSLLNYLSSTINKGDTPSRLNNRKKLYVKLYEKLHPDEAKSINTFFEKSSKDGISERDITNIKYKSYKSDGSAHKIFFDNISKCRVNSWNHSGTAFYRSIDNSEGEWGVYLDITGSDGLDDKDGAYTTFFHEIGHNIDDLMFEYDGEYDATGKKVSGVTLTSIIQGNSDVNFYTALYSDTESYFTQAVDAVNDKLGYVKLNDESKRQVVEALLDGRKKWTTLNPYERAIYNAIKDSLEFHAFKNLAVSDLVGGVTNNTVSGQSLSFTSIISTGASGHERSYWYSGNSATAQQGKEFFAEYMSYHMTGQEDKISDMRRVFPTACKMMDKAWGTGGITYSGVAEDEKYYKWSDTITK